MFSQGYVCPKGIAIAEIHADQDRLRRPVRRNAAGEFEEISWDAAFDLVASRLRETRDRHGCDAVGFYWGNPTGNNHGALLMLSSFTKALDPQPLQLRADNDVKRAEAILDEAVERARAEERELLIDGRTGAARPRCRGFWRGDRL